MISFGEPTRAKYPLVNPNAGRQMPGNRTGPLGWSNTLNAHAHLRGGPRVTMQPKLKQQANIKHEPMAMQFTSNGDANASGYPDLAFIPPLHHPAAPSSFTLAPPVGTEDTTTANIKTENKSKKLSAKVSNGAKPNRPKPKRKNLTVDDTPQLNLSLTPLDWLTISSLPQPVAAKPANKEKPAAAVQPEAKEILNILNKSTDLNYRVNAELECRLNPNIKPQYELEEIIIMAIRSNKMMTLTLDGICQWVSRIFPFYRNRNSEVKRAVKESKKIIRNANKDMKPAHYIVESDSPMQAKRSKSATPTSRGIASARKNSLKERPSYTSRNPTRPRQRSLSDPPNKAQNNHPLSRTPTNDSETDFQHMRSSSMSPNSTLGVLPEESMPTSMNYNAYANHDQSSRRSIALSMQPDNQRRYGMPERIDLHVGHQQQGHMRHIQSRPQQKLRNSISSASMPTGTFLSGTVGGLPMSQEKEHDTFMTRRASVSTYTDVDMDMDMYPSSSSMFGNESSIDNIFKLSFDLPKMPMPDAQGSEAAARANTNSYIKDNTGLFPSPLSNTGGKFHGESTNTSKCDTATDILASANAALHTSPPINAFKPGAHYVAETEDCGGMNDGFLFSMPTVHHTSPMWPSQEWGVSSSVQSIMDNAHGDIYADANGDADVQPRRCSSATLDAMDMGSPFGRNGFGLTSNEALTRQHSQPDMMFPPGMESTATRTARTMSANLDGNVNLSHSTRLDSLLHHNVGNVFRTSPLTTNSAIDLRTHDRLQGPSDGTRLSISEEMSARANGTMDLNDPESSLSDILTASQKCDFSLYSMLDLSAQQPHGQSIGGTGLSMLREQQENDDRDDTGMNARAQVQNTNALGHVHSSGVAEDDTSFPSLAPGNDLAYNPNLGIASFLLNTADLASLTLHGVDVQSSMMFLDKLNNDDMNPNLIVPASVDVHGTVKLHSSKSEHAIKALKKQSSHILSPLSDDLGSSALVDNLDDCSLVTPDDWNYLI
ncbi:hypothetical protein SARC_06800 [Sphaeroforma arctica JP610]|uniref:Fork-head domain-containing protein n=1 Tax=Sphaeroforma arctica JP610 TaxID=667725 RepID=A0A0L0FW33_9EUKA|nr:hypothetical protein SARC_06800 [Sphaeroforma arctica JP610]KNC80859.1 hypothetical protein SARC_06800 [Sphaeroforma arctica JP610]|eukprot:XP_014154761.1 hypothetical protein SARC_06800 [Sphaeroforma arctica JP610]